MGNLHRQELEAGKNPGLSARGRWYTLRTAFSLSRYRDCRVAHRQKLRDYGNRGNSCGTVRSGRSYHYAVRLL